MTRALFIAALVLATPAFAQTAYFSVLDDLPLPPGFSESAPPGVFEAPEGRILALSAEGAGEGLAVRDFYYETLPALGWAEHRRGDGALEFRRGRERLSFTLERAGGRLLLGVQVVELAAD
ncbi:MAG TPA: hypothetical protein PLK37_06225 [Terricaulis sp.]|nr:hypothetical protein [Terricaulis sp.]